MCKKPKLKYACPSCGGTGRSTKWQFGPGARCPTCNGRIYVGDIKIEVSGHPDEVYDVASKLMKDASQSSENPPLSADSSVEFSESGGVKRVENVTSADAASIAKGVVHRGEKGLSAPASASPSTEVLNAAAPAKGKLHGVPRSFVVNVVAGVFVVLLAAYFGLEQCASQQTISTNAQQLE